MRVRQKLYKDGGMVGSTVIEDFPDDADLQLLARAATSTVQELGLGDKVTLEKL